MNRTMTFKHLICGALLAGTLAFNTDAAQAQGLFSPAALVNDQVVTNYEVDQRAKFYRAIRRFGDLQRISTDELIGDRLKEAEGARLGVEISPEAVVAGIEEFAARGNLNAQDFLKAMAAEGVDAQTVRDFVESGLIWREVVAARFANRVQVSESEIDAALGSEGQAGLRVLLSEVIIPLTPETEEQVFEVATQISELKSFGAFSEAATKYSASATRERGGRLDWLPLSQLPGPLRPVVLALRPGEVSAPLELDQAVAIFQMRSIEELPVPATNFAAIEYGVLRIPGGRSPEALARAAEIRAGIDTCDDLYGVNFGGPDEALTVTAQAPSEIPRAVALELAKLDRHEVSTALTTASGDQLLFIMLCGRTAEANQEASRAQVADALRNRRITAYADGYLEQLRSEATIVEK